MLNNYLKIFFRNILKHRTSSFVNITGLAIAIAGCVFILLFVFDELKYDQFNANKDRIYRYVERSKTTGETAVIIPACNFANLRDNLPEIEGGFRVMRNTEQTIYIGNKSFIEDIYWADSEILSVLSFPLLKGDQKTALKDPFSVVITGELARKYFGNDDPVGKTIKMEDKYDYKITGILKDIPANSQLKSSMIVSITTLNTTNSFVMNDWHVSSCLFYFLVKPNISKALFEDKVGRQVKEKYGAEWARLNNIVLEPFSQIYLNPTGSAWDFAEHGDIKTVRSFIIIAILILLMASFNYTNTLTTNIKIREKEITARKILGARRKDIIFQFLFETVLYLFISLFIGLVIIRLLMNLFNQLTGKQLTPYSLLSPEIVISVLGLIILTALFSILYPVFITFKSDTLNKQKGNAFSNHFNFSRYTFGFRQVVTGLQFIITIGLMICAGIIYNQLNYANTARLGFNKEHLLSIANSWDQKMYDRFESYRNKILQYPHIVSVSACTNYPSENINNYTFIYQKGKSNKETFYTAQVAIDYDLLKTWQAKIIAGRDFSRDITSDKDHAVIITNSAAKVLNLSDPLNVELNGVNNAADGQKIIGVVEDIHFKSFKEKMMPIVFYLRSWCAANIVVRLSGNEIASTMKILEKEWGKIMPGKPFIYKFIDESFDNLYQSEQRTEKLIIIFCAFAMIISILGLVSLISLISQTRKKEIGVRKVLGASVSGIVFMTIKEFILIILASNIIAWPVAYYFMNKWLEDFAYRIDISWWTFVLAGGIALLIALVTVSYQAVRAAIANPVEALRYE